MQGQGMEIGTANVAEPRKQSRLRTAIDGARRSAEGATAIEHQLDMIIESLVAEPRPVSDEANPPTPPRAGLPALEDETSAAIDAHARILEKLVRLNELVGL